MRRALITGGSGGIGAAVCRRLAADGAHVLVHANASLDVARRIAAEIVADGGSAEALGFDVTDADATRVALEGALERGTIDILVNNAGVHDDAVFPALRADQWRRVIDVSLHGFFHMTQPLVMPMIRRRWGRIVNVSSITALVGNHGQVNYAAAKGALQTAGRSLALELASRGITVNSVAPGVIATAMGEDAFDARRVEQLVPMKRMGTAEEVADLVAFLASDRAAYITGQVIAIDGGIS